MPPRLTPAHPVTRAQTITVSVPTPLRNCCAGAAEIALAARNLRDVLQELEQGHPALHRSICDDCRGLDTSLEPGDVVTIMTAVSGG
jgi:molybdopterin converting factor small subunit